MYVEGSWGQLFSALKGLCQVHFSLTITVEISVNGLKWSVLLTCLKGQIFM